MEVKKGLMEVKFERRNFVALENKEDFDELEKILDEKMKNTKNSYNFH
ncbi:hypothetical protein [Acidianus sp. HS-5]|nr:hypothetical protein [Acidianus sp. HS-5]BDC17900.1 hypothetical protein HS5_07900 [Acidianus sp. HS-5]